MRQFAIISLFTVLLCGCGQKGPLYLPDDVKNPSPQAEQAPAPKKPAVSASDKTIQSTQ